MSDILQCTMLFRYDYVFALCVLICCRQFLIVAFPLMRRRLDALNICNNNFSVLNVEQISILKSAGKTDGRAD